MYTIHRPKNIFSYLMLLGGLILLLSLQGSPAIAAQPDAAFIREVRALEGDETGLVNPAGLAFSPGAGAFHVVEARGQGQPLAPDTDIIKLTPFGDRAGSARIAAAIRDPINMVFDTQFNRLLAFQSSANKLIEVLEDPNGDLDPRTLIRHDARHFGLQDPQGMTIDPATGHLFFLDIAGPRLVRVEPEPDGSFENAVITEVDLQPTGLVAPRGLAFDPTTAHLHVLNPAEQALYELTPTGQVVTTRNLSNEAVLYEPRGMVFAPSGDLTDDPAQMSLYLSDQGLGAGGPGANLSQDGAMGAQASGDTQSSGHILELSFVEPPTVEATSFQSSLVQTIETWQWSPSSPDASGVIYLPASNHLFVSDGEVNEMSIFDNANLFEATLTGTLVGTGCTTNGPSPCGLNYSDEPTGVGLNPNNGHMFLSDDTGTASIHVITNTGSDGNYGTPDDTVTTFSSENFNAHDAEGVTYATGLDVLFIADGLNNEIYQLAPGNNGVFDGVPPQGDDQVVGSFDTFNFGLEDPEGIAYNPDTGTLYLAGKTRNIGRRNFDTLIEVTTSGTLVQTIDVSDANPNNIHPKQKLSGLAYAPSSVGGGMSIYIADRGDDNNNDPNENDGRVYEMSLPASANSGPTAHDDFANTSQETAVVIDVAANDTDPNGNLAPTTANSTCANGSTGCLGAANGTLSDNGDGTITYTPEAGFTGSDSFVYEICDTEPLCDTATVNITVTAPNDPPVAQDDSVSGDEDTLLSGNVLADNGNGADSDPDGNLDPNSVTLDGAAPTNGALTLNPDGSFDYTPNANFNGTDTFAYQVCDDLNACDTATVTLTITPVADPPIANDDSASTSEGTAVILDVVANDTDPDGDLNPSSATATSGPSKGTLVNHSDGTFTYTPSPTTTAPDSDSFVYQICDSGSPSLCDTATVTIDITGDQIIYVSSTSGGNVGGVSFGDEDILAYDPSTGSWSMHFDGSDVGLGASGQEIDALHLNADGTILLSLGADGTIPDVGAVDDSDVVRFTPTSLGSNTAGTYELYFDGSDVDLTTTGEDIDSMGFAPDGRLIISTRGSFGVSGVSGKDEDLLAFTATSLGASTSGTWSLYFDGSDVGLDASSEDVTGTWIDGNGDIYLSVRGAFSVAGASGDGADIFTCVPASTGNNTSCTFSLFWDGSGHGFGSETLNGFFLSGGSGGQSNNPPVATTDSAITSQETAVVIDVAANDTDSDGNLDSTSANRTCATCSDPSNGTLVNNNDGTFTYTPDAGFTGSDSFVYEICDTEPLCDTATVNITITAPNDPPVAQDDSVNGDEDTLLSGNVLADNGNGADSDPDGNLGPNPVTLVGGGPTNGALTLNPDGSFDYTPNADFNGTDSFTYQVCDDLNACDTATVTLTITPVADPPIANDDNASTTVAALVTIDVADNDSDPDGDLDPTSANVTCVGCSDPTNGTLANNGDGSFDYTPNAGFEGADSYVYEICDTGASCDTATVSITVSPAGPIVLEVQVSASSDDAEERNSGRMELTSGDLDLGIKPAAVRFTSVTIPPGATINDAYIQFQADASNSTATSLIIEGEASDDAPTFTSSTNDITSRSRTVASVSWSTPAWTSGDAGLDQRTPNIAAVIHEIVNRPQWVSGNAIVIIITGTGDRDAETSDGRQSAGAPLLHVEYTAP